MQIGKVFVSKIYRLWNHFVFGLGLEFTNHVHKKHEGEYKDIVEWELDEIDVDEICLTLEFLLWGIDIQIPKN